MLSKCLVGKTLINACVLISGSFDAQNTSIGDVSDGLTFFNEFTVEEPMNIERMNQMTLTDQLDAIGIVRQKVTGRNTQRR